MPMRFAFDTVIADVCIVPVHKKLTAPMQCLGPKHRVPILNLTQRETYEQEAIHPVKRVRLSDSADIRVSACAFSALAS